MTEEFPLSIFTSHLLIRLHLCMCGGTVGVTDRSGSQIRTHSALSEITELLNINILFLL